MNIDLTSLLGLDRIDLSTAIQKALEVNEAPIIALNDQQLDRGINANSESLGKYKNFKYKGRYEPIDLKLKGDFRKAENIKISHGGNNFELIDNDVKTPFLIKNFGKDILGLTDDSINQAANIIQPDVINNLEEQLA